MRILVRGLILLLCAIGIGAAFAQHPALPPNAPEPPKAAPSAKAPDAPPQLTETETLKLENLQLKATVLQTQQQELQQQFVALLNAISAEHPGFTFDPNSRTFRPAPKPAAAEKKPAEGKK